jgi:predicted nucleic acid-binding protein
VRVFLDTNVLLDIAWRRPPFAAASRQVLERCDLLGCELSIAAHGLATIFHLAERMSGSHTAIAMVHQLLGWAEVAPLGDMEARAALGYGIRDYEDALQAAAAVSAGADWLVTRDAVGFAGCPVPTLSPDEFLGRFPAATVS